ncbi:MAG: Hsp20/alpha crystallin family protein [Chitinophagaceae bacterium]
MTSTTIKKSTLLKNSIRKKKGSSASVSMDEDRQEYIVYVVVPGMQRQDISIKIRNKELTVTALKEQALHCYMDSEKQLFSQWTESFILPDDADTVMTAAVYRNGELQIHIPKGKNGSSDKPVEVFVY